jgi:hypothetical protein
MSKFSSVEEFQTVMDRVFTMMNEDPEMGPRLREADIPQQFEFSDFEVIVNIRAVANGSNENIEWVWNDEVDWEPRVKLTMSSETANRYFQGKENIGMAFALRKIKASGDLGAALKIAPVIEPIYPRYTAMIEHDYPHLKV